MAIRALLVEDDIEISSLLVKFLEENDIECTSTKSPVDAMFVLKDEKFDVLILDIGLPFMSGIQLCKKVRESSNIAIIMSTAVGGIDDKLEALLGGADDYIAKPYDPRELLARIYSILKRTSPKEELKSFRVDDGVKKIYKGSVALELTTGEYEILKTLIKSAGNIISREDIANSIDSHRFESGVESISVLIGRIRKKIGEESGLKYIKTIRGLGYKFVY